MSMYDVKWRLSPSQDLERMFKLETEYRGSTLCLELENNLENNQARLLINGIVRDQGIVTSSLCLSTTVQTDYEWHEFIEGIISREGKTLTAVLIANKAEVSRRDFTVVAKDEVNS